MILTVHAMYTCNGRAQGNCLKRGRLQCRLVLDVRLVARDEQDGEHSRLKARPGLWPGLDRARKDRAQLLSAQSESHSSSRGGLV